MVTYDLFQGSNRYCLDKNYAGVLIIWDRMFGTFEQERQTEKIVFGLVDQPQYFNPIRHQVKKQNPFCSWWVKNALIFFLAGILSESVWEVPDHEQCFGQDFGLCEGTRLVPWNASAWWSHGSARGKPHWWNIYIFQFYMSPECFRFQSEKSTIQSARGQRSFISTGILLSRFSSLTIWDET